MLFLSSALKKNNYHSSFFFFLEIFQKNREEIQFHFTELVNNIQKCMEKKAVNVSEVRTFLVRFFRLGDSCSIPRDSLEQIFTAVSLNNLWNYEHCFPVEKLVKKFLPEEMGMMKTYNGYLTGFYTAINLIEYIKCANISNDEENDNSFSPQGLNQEHYKQLKIKLNIKKKVSELSLIYVRDLWISIADIDDLPSLTAVLKSLGIGSLEITWLILPHEAETIKMSVHKSLPFFHQHHIVYVAIDGRQIFDAKVRTLLGHNYSFD